MDQLIPSDPTHIGPYRLIARLGASGMGLVHLGRSEAGRTVAVKVVQDEHAQHPEFRRRFARDGGVLGAALLGSVLTSAIAARLEAVPGLPPTWANAAGSGRFISTQGVPPQLADVIDKATVTGCTDALWWSVGITLLAGLAAALLVRSTGPVRDQRDTR
ncbi:hypothetical protein [Streptomyces atratus]|uniref:hypothetical protein n=1 Tax=Streptomyces atratus TaxID=1893 RepID=UPI0013008710